MTADDFRASYIQTIGCLSMLHGVRVPTGYKIIGYVGAYAFYPLYYFTCT